MERAGVPTDDDLRLLQEVSELTQVRRRSHARAGGLGKDLFAGTPDDQRFRSDALGELAEVGPDFVGLAGAGEKDGDAGRQMARSRVSDVLDLTERLLAAVAGMGFMMLQSSATPRISTADFTLTLLVIVVLGGVGYRWGAIVGGIVYTILDQRLADLASAAWIQQLPDVLRIPLSEPLFLFGVLFILVVMFLPGGIAGTIDAAVRRRRGEKVRDPLRQMDDADDTADAPAEARV